MRSFSVEDLRSIIKDVKSNDEKRTLYILIGVFVALAAVAVGVAAMLAKKHCDCAEDEDFYHRHLL